MDPTEAELAGHFAALEDEALLHAGADRRTLTLSAQGVVTREIRRRGLPLPPLATPELPEADLQPETWTKVERFRDLSAAIVARSALEAMEIPCFLRDENTVRMDWQISNFIGGMRLEVREQDAAAASAVLSGTAIDAPPAADVREEGSDACPRCGSEDVHRDVQYGWFSVAMVFLFSIPAPQGKRRWTCSACGNRWSEHGST